MIFVDVLQFAVAMFDIILGTVIELGRGVWFATMDLTKPFGRIKHVVGILRWSSMGRTHMHVGTSRRCPQVAH